MPSSQTDEEGCEDTAHPRKSGSRRGAAPPAHIAKRLKPKSRICCILTQRTKDKNKLYALDAPDVECISKVKARTPCEFGAKVSIATTLKESLVVGIRCMPGNPYDDHTLTETLEQVGSLTGTV